MTEVRPDFKPAKRKKTKTYRNKLLRDTRCRNEMCPNMATDAHHILKRSGGGDDVQENIMPLCHACHMKFHAGQLPHLRVFGDERAYLIGKLGEGRAKSYLDRYSYDGGWRIHDRATD